MMLVVFLHIIMLVFQSQRQSDTECSFTQENSISWESGQADISSKIYNRYIIRWYIFKDI